MKAHDEFQQTARITQPKWVTLPNVHVGFTCTAFVFTGHKLFRARMVEFVCRPGVGV